MKNDTVEAVNGEEDELLQEIPVYLTKCDKGEIFVLQYPTLNNDTASLDGEITSARLKKDCRLVELEQAVQQLPIYDEGKGEQLALNADGAMRDQRDPEDNYFTSGYMDKIILRSGCPLRNTDRYAVGHYTEKEGLCLTPVDCVMPLRPALDYIDKSDERATKEKKGDEEETEEGAADGSDSRLVTAHFGRSEMEKRKHPAAASYDTLQKRKEAEPWIPIEYNGLGSSYSEHQKLLTTENICSDPIDQFHLTPSHFLSLLVPQATNYTVAAGAVNASASAEELAADIPMTMLYTFPVERQLETIMRKVGVGSFYTILECLEKDVQKDESLLIQKLQMSATLVQGCWVLKSAILYPDGGALEGQAPPLGGKKGPPPQPTTPSGTPFADMQQAREYALCLLAKDGSLERRTVHELFPLPGEDMLAMLRGVARPATADSNVTGKWLFRLPVDEKFSAKHKDVVRRYSMKWDRTLYRYHNNS